MNTLELNTKEINKTVHELCSAWNIDLNNRLKKYITEVEPNLNFSEVKNYFLNDADPYNIKTPTEQYDIYFKNLNEFLSQYGY